MGVKGLYSFVTNDCPGACTAVNLKVVAEKHRSKYPGSTPVLVVDAMGCIRKWYTAESWVCGGQWREYLSELDGFINTFTAAGIKLVFYFDGVVEQKKRSEWVVRRLNNNKEIAKIFRFIKTYKRQPGREMFFIPSGLATFTRFGLKTLGQETICSLREGDYEVASYALHNNCMGILGEDTDYLIFDTAPYFSIKELHLHRLDTVMFSRQNLCSRLGLYPTDLPLLACILGTDIVPAKVMERFRNQCVASYCAKSQGSNEKSSVILAVANYISSISRSYGSLIALAEKLPLGSDKSLLCNGIESYLLPGQQSPWLPCDFSHRSAASVEQEVPLCLDQEILQLAKEKHVRAESHTTYNVMCSGEIECSNTLEDEDDTELPGQALIFLPARRHIYSLLLESAKDVNGTYPVVKEWFVYAGNSLKQPDLVQPKELPGGTPSLRSLWLSSGPETEKLRHWTFLACFQLQEIAEEIQALEGSVAVVCCLLLYLFLQLAQVDSRGVQLGSLFIRGLGVMIKANNTCGLPFKADDIMPWSVFDGKLFHTKYLQAHRGCSLHDLLEDNESWLAKFQDLMSLICRTCSARGRIIQSRKRLDSFVTERRGRGRGTHFRNPNRIPSRPYRDQGSDCLWWRNPQPPGHSSQSQPPGRGYGPRHQPPRGQRF
nr:constitutive coactivator of peroxisome proliferator-activated receptor gamma isoform X2 [Zootoca vivipara]